MFAFKENDEIRAISFKGNEIGEWLETPGHKVEAIALDDILKAIADAQYAVNEFRDFSDKKKAEIGEYLFDAFLIISETKEEKEKNYDNL